MAYYTVDIDKENSGVYLTNALVNELDRNGNSLHSKLAYTHTINHSTVLESAILYQTFSADGDAMSNDQLGVELSYRKTIGRHAFALSASYKETSFDDNNPVFDKEQEDTQVGAFSAYEYSNVMGWDNVALNAIAGYEHTSSNIDFYESTGYLVGLGATYKF